MAVAALSLDSGSGVAIAQSAPIVRASAADPHAAHPYAAHPYAAHIADASKRFGIPERWIRAVLRAESAGDVRAISSAGAIGLMQVMPDTWAALRMRYRLGRNPYAPRDNILAGTAYLREMWDRYGTIAAMLAAYNAGPALYDEHRTKGRPLPAETRAYVASLAPMLRGERPSKIAAVAAKPLDWREAGAFVVRGGDASDVELLPLGRRPAAPQSSPVATPQAPFAPASQGLFVARDEKGTLP